MANNHTASPARVRRTARRGQTMIFIIFALVIGALLVLFNADLHRTIFAKTNLAKIVRCRSALKSTNKAPMTRAKMMKIIVCPRRAVRRTRAGEAVWLLAIVLVHIERVVTFDVG